MIVSDKEYIDRLRLGDILVLGELFSLYKEDIFKILYHRVADKSTIEDYIQQTFVKLWEKRTKVELENSLKSYIFRIAINLVLDDRKHQEVKKKHLENVVKFHENEDDTKYEDERIHLIHRIINKLPVNLSQSFYLSRYNELTYKEIAITLGVSVKTIESYISKVLRILREEFKAD